MGCKAEDTGYGWRECADCGYTEHECVFECQKESMPLWFKLAVVMIFLLIVLSITMSYEFAVDVLKP